MVLRLGMRLASSRHLPTRLRTTPTLKGFHFAPWRIGLNLPNEGRTGRCPRIKFPASEFFEMSGGGNASETCEQTRRPRSRHRPNLVDAEL